MRPSNNTTPHTRVCILPNHIAPVWESLLPKSRIKHNRSPPCSSNMPPQHMRTKTRKNQPVFFYKPQERHGILCQWYLSPFTVSNSAITSLVGTHISSDATDAKTEVNCAEQFMMYCKAARFSDESRQRRVLKNTHPSVQKRIGKKVDGFCEEYWTPVKSQVVEMGNYAKFTQNSQLRSWLLGTGDRELVEASGRDKVWGIGFIATTENEIEVALEKREHWGENRLGKALMAVRARIREEMNNTEGGEGAQS